MVVFFCSSISVVLSDTPGIFRCHNMLFLSSPHLRFITGLICDLFVSYVDSLTDYETFMQTKCLAEGKSWDPVKLV